jgi:hypothetical protein
MKAILTINVSKELEKSIKILNGISELSSYCFDEATAISVQQHCVEATGSLLNIIAAIKADRLPE